MPTTNLNLRYLATTDVLDEVVINDALNQADTRLLSVADVVVTSDADITLTNTNGHAAQSSNLTVRVRDPDSLLTVTRRITFPAIKGSYVIDNTTAQSIECWIGSGTVITIPTLDSGYVYSDGTDMFLIKLGRSVGGGGAFTDVGNFEIPMTFIGTILPSRELVRFTFTRSVIFKPGLLQSVGSAGTVPTSSFDFTLKRNGASIGTANFAAAAAVATFSFVSTVIFVPGDVLSIDSQAVADATLANVGFMFHAEKV